MQQPSASGNPSSGATMQVHHSAAAQDRLAMLNRMGNDRRSMGDVTKAANKNGTNDAKDSKRFSLAVAHANELDAVRLARQRQREQAKQQTKREMREYLKTQQISEQQTKQATSHDEQAMGAAAGTAATATAPAAAAAMAGAPQAQAQGQYPPQYQAQAAGPAPPTRQAPVHPAQQAQAAPQGHAQAGHGHGHQQAQGHGYSEPKSSTDARNGTGAGSGSVAESTDSKDAGDSARRLSNSSRAMVEEYHNHPNAASSGSVNSGSSGTINVKEMLRSQHAADPATAAVIARQMSMDSNPENGKAGDVGTGDSKSKIASMFSFGKNKSGAKSKKKKKVAYTVNNEKYVLYSYYKPVRQIGDGAYATVIEAIDKRNDSKVAIKKNRGVFNNISDAKRILREIKLLCHFNHINIMPLLSVIPPDAHEREDFKDVYLVMPKMDMTLHKVIRKQKLTEKHIQWILYQVLRGLQYMHSAGVIHRDLKPDNILVNATDCIVKITDFGLARGVLPDHENQKLTEYVVTRWYRAPEVMCCSRRYDEQVDTWAVGCIAAEFYQPKKYPVFQGRNHIDQLQLIFDLMGTPTDLTWIKTPDARQWISKMKPKPAKDLTKEFPDAPPTGIDFIGKMLRVDPGHRLSVTEALKHPWIGKYESEFNRGDRYKYQTCPRFDLSFEFEKKITTKFGVRHMMYEELIHFKKNRHQKLVELQKQRDMEAAQETRDKQTNNGATNGATEKNA